MHYIICINLPFVIFRVYKSRKNIYHYITFMFFGIAIHSQMSSKMSSRLNPCAICCPFTKVISFTYQHCHDLFLIYLITFLCTFLFTNPLLSLTIKMIGFCRFSLPIECQVFTGYLSQRIFVSFITYKA